MHRMLNHMKPQSSQVIRTEQCRHARDCSSWKDASSKFRLASVVVSALCLFAASAQAVPVSLGLFNPPPGGESAADELAFLNNTVLTAFPALPDATFGTENVNVGGNLISITLDISNFSYIKLKWDGMWQFYEIIGEAGNFTFNSTVFNQQGQPQALSHYTFFGPDDSQNPPPTVPPGVPDGGNALILMSLGLVGLALARRRWRA